VMTVRRGRAALAEEGAAGVAEVLGWGRSTPGTPVEVAEGSRGREDHRRRVISVAGGLTVGGFGSNSGEHRDGGYEHGSVVNPGTWAELLRRSQAVGLQRTGVPAAARLGSKQGQGSGRDPGFGGGAVEMRWSKGGVGE
jgi:hypothetical protein